MTNESLKSAISDIKVYSNGLETALDNDRLTEASDYVNSVRLSLDRIVDYIDSRLAEEQDNYSNMPPDLPLTDAGKALWAAQQAEEKARWLERTSDQRIEEGKRLKNQAREAKKEAKRARDAANKAQDAERKATEQSIKAAKEAAKAKEAAR